MCGFSFSVVPFLYNIPPYISPYMSPVFIPSSHPMLPVPVFSALARSTQAQEFGTMQVAYLGDKSSQKPLFMCKTDVVPVSVVPLKRARA